MFINSIYEKLENGKYIASDVEMCKDPGIVYESLAMDLISKKINCCQWIKSIKRKQLYNGFIQITVIYCNDGKPYGRRIYTVKNV